MRAAWPCAVLAAGVVLGAQAATPEEVLARMSEAARTVNYEGVVIYRGDQMLETFRVTHRFQDGVERERVQSLNGEPREIHKQDNVVTCLLPRDRRLTAARPTPKDLFPAMTAERIRQIVQVYEFDDLGTERVAGRICRRIAITPRDQYRYGYEIWADEQTAVPLQVNLIGHDGVVLEQMMFTEVEFPAEIPDAAFVVDPERAAQLPQVIRTEVAPPDEPAASLPAPPGWELDRMPPGYRVIMHDQRTLPNGSGIIHHWVLSDGLSAISIFGKQRQNAPERPAQPVTQMGAVHAYRRRVGSFHITVVGEAPSMTVRMIGDGVIPAVTPATEVDAAP
jgi:sigma-E factor negative regulatory protein RseB